MFKTVGGETKMSYFSMVYNVFYYEFLTNCLNFSKLKLDRAEKEAESYNWP